MCVLPRFARWSNRRDDSQWRQESCASVTREELCAASRVGLVRPARKFSDVDEHSEAWREGRRGLFTHASSDSLGRCVLGFHNESDELVVPLWRCQVSHGRHRRVWDLRHFKRQSHEVHVVECRWELDVCASCLSCARSFGTVRWWSPWATVWCRVTGRLCDPAACRSGSYPCGPTVDRHPSVDSGARYA